MTRQKNHNFEKPGYELRNEGRGGYVVYFQQDIAFLVKKNISKWLDM